MENEEFKQMESNTTFRVYLKRELERRCRENPNYSLRAFSRQINVDPSLLSKFISGKRTISNKSIERIGLQLGLKIGAIQAYKKKEDHNSCEPDYHQVSLDEFDLISQWEHYAILELMKLSEFKGDPKWIAKRLKLRVSEVNSFISRLKRVGLLKISENNLWIDLSNGHRSHIISVNLSSHAHKQLQKTILTKAIDSLYRDPIDERDQSSMILATNPKKIEQAKEMLTNFRRTLTTFLEDTDEKTAVYQMSLSLFPVVKDDKGVK